MITITLRPGPAVPPAGAWQVRVTIDNPGEALEIDNPAALLHQPRWRLAPMPDGAEVELDNWQNFDPPDGQPARLQLGAGSRWQATVPLRLPEGREGPGLWRASLVIATPQGPVTSEPCLLQVQDWQLLGADAQHGVPPFGEIDGDALLLQAGGKLYRMPWADDDSDRQGHGGAAPVALLDVAPDACDLLVPARDSPFWRDPARWMLWREGAVVHALGTSGQRQLLTLPEVPAALLRPALQRDRGPVELYALSAGRDHVLRLRLDRAAAVDPQVVERLDLPLPVASGRAAFAPVGGSLLGLHAAADGGVVLLLWRAGVLQQARWDGGLLLETCPPALLATADGAVTVATLARHDDELLLVSARFAGDGAAAVDARPIGRIDAVPLAGALMLVPPHADHADGEQGGHGQRLAFVVLRLADGGWMRLGDEGQLERTTFEATPVQPLTMAVGGHGAFILACHPQQGPFMAEA